MIFSLALFCMSLAFRESRPDLLLHQRFKLLQAESDKFELRLESADSSPTISHFVQEAAVRPLKLLFTEPIVLICSFMNGIAFALVFALTEALTIVYSAFGFSDQATSLAFVPVLLGVLLSSFNRVYDQRAMKKLRVAERMDDLPELKVRSFAVSAPALAAGLWLFAWTIPPRVLGVHWIVSMVGLVAVGYAANDFDTVLCGYLVDVSPVSYTRIVSTPRKLLVLTDGCPELYNVCQLCPWRPWSPPRPVDGGIRMLHPASIRHARFQHRHNSPCRCVNAILYQPNHFVALWSCAEKKEPLCKVQH